MKIIFKASESVLPILKRFVDKSNCTRWSQYCVQTFVDDGVLVFNLLTREFIFLTREEYTCFADVDYLKEHCFVVPQENREKEQADFVKWVLAMRQPKPKEITSYTIFTTTDCNARCFYCFELGHSRIPMSCETAEKVVRYIKNHCNGKEVHINWFGGEPLYNMKAIDVITDGLHRENIKFRSKMVTNGYLFDQEIISRAVCQWHLKRVQITLDGTEKIYNKIKAFIYNGGSPYEIVMANIGRLLDAGIGVSIRLNMDLYNAEDLMTLAEELAQRFAEKKGLFVYADHLFNADKPNAELHSEAEWGKRETAMKSLEERLEKCGLLSAGGISPQIKLNHCMADSGKAITILPDGRIGLCEHHTEDEHIGHLDDENFDAEVITSWKERTPEIPECAECFYYTDCIKLKKCSSSSVCYRQYREEKLRHIQRAMLHTYRNWQEGIAPDVDADEFVE